MNFLICDAINTLHEAGAWFPRRRGIAGLAHPEVLSSSEFGISFRKVIRVTTIAAKTPTSERN